MPARSILDTFDRVQERKAAEKQKAKIEAFWAERGVNITVAITELTGKDGRALFVLRSTVTGNTVPPPLERAR